MYYNFCFEIDWKKKLLLLFYVYIFELKISCMVAIRVKICKCNFVSRFI